MVPDYADARPVPELRTRLDLLLSITLGQALKAANASRLTLVVRQFDSRVVERLMPCLPLSTKLFPAFSPPQGGPSCCSHPLLYRQVRDLRSGRRPPALSPAACPLHRDQSARRGAGAKGRSSQKSQPLFMSCPEEDSVLNSS